VALVENAMKLAIVQLQSAPTFSLAESQLLLSSANSLTATLMSTTQGFIILQPTLQQANLVSVAVQSLQNQQVLISQLCQVVLTKVPQQAVGVFQTGFGQAVSSLNFGVAQLQGQGNVAVQLVNAGQIPANGVDVLAQQCASIGFAPINQVVGVNGIGVQNQQLLVQQCSAVGFVDVRQVQVFQQVLGQQQLINQCSAVGFVPVNNQFIQQDLGNQCLQIGFVPANQVQEQSNQQDLLNQCAQIGFVQASGMAMSGEEIVGSLMYTQVIQGIPMDQVNVGQFPPGVEQLAQQCNAIGFVQANLAQQQQFVASPEQCAAFGLVQQGNVNGQGVVDQCAALGFQPGQNVNAEAVAQLEQQLGIQQGGEVQAQTVQAQEAAATETASPEAASAGATASKAKGPKAKRSKAAVAAETVAAGTAAIESATSTTASAEAAQATQVAGQVNAEQCLQLGFVQANNMANATSVEVAAASATATESVATAEASVAAETAPEMRFRRRRASFYA
jgi:hypothetical protein